MNKFIPDDSHYMVCLSNDLNAAATVRLETDMLYHANKSDT